MKLFLSMIICMFLLCAALGCERTEKAIDLYKKTSVEGSQKEEGRQVEPQRRGIENKIRDAYNAKDKEYREKEEAAQSR